MQPLQNVERPKFAPQPIIVETRPRAGSIDARPPAAPAPQVPPDANGSIKSLQLMGMDPAVVVAMVLFDFGQSTLDWLTFGLFFVFSFILSACLAIYVYNIQKDKCGDTKGIAAGKASIAFALMILPTPLFSLLAVPSGIAGFLRNREAK